MKCRSTLLIRIWILAFCLCIEVCNALFLPWKWSSHWHWWLLCAAACQACLPSQDIDCKVIEWKFRCPILAAATSSLPDIFHLQWSCLKSTLLITRVSQLSLFLMKVFVKPFMNWLSLKEIINKQVESEFSILRDYGRNKRHGCVHHVWCMDPEIWKTSLKGTKGFGTIRQKKFIPCTGLFFALGFSRLERGLDPETLWSWVRWLWTFFWIHLHALSQHFQPQILFKCISEVVTKQGHIRWKRQNSCFSSTICAIFQFSCWSGSRYGHDQETSWLSACPERFLSIKPSFKKAAIPGPQCRHIPVQSRAHHFPGPMAGTKFCNRKDNLTL